MVVVATTSRLWTAPIVRAGRSVHVGFFCAVIASFVAAMTRVISSGEITGAEQSILGLLGWMGVLFVAIDGIGSWSRLQVLLRRVSLLVGFEALVGIIQFAAGKSFVDGLHVPGLTWNAPVQITARDGFFGRQALRRTRWSSGWRFQYSCQLFFSLLSTRRQVAAYGGGSRYRHCVWRFRFRSLARRSSPRRWCW